MSHIPPGLLICVLVVMAEQVGQGLAGGQVGGGEHVGQVREVGQVTRGGHVRGGGHVGQVVGGAHVGQMVGGGQVRRGGGGHVHSGQSTTRQQLSHCGRGGGAANRIYVLYHYTYLYVRYNVIIHNNMYVYCILIIIGQQYLCLVKYSALYYMHALKIITYYRWYCSPRATKLSICEYS